MTVQDMLIPSISAEGQLVRMHIFVLRVPSCLSRPLGVAADNLHFVRMHLLLTLELEVDVLYQKRPNFVTEAVGIQMSLCEPIPSASPRPRESCAKRLYLE